MSQSFGSNVGGEGALSDSNLSEQDESAKDYTTEIYLIHVRLYNKLEEINKSNARITKDVLKFFKGQFDSANELAIENRKRTIIAETKIEMLEISTKKWENMALRLSDSISSLKTVERSGVNEELHSLLITPLEGQDMEKMRRELRENERSNEQLPKPKDIIYTKENNIILKYKSRTEAQEMESVIKDNENFEGKVNIRIGKGASHKVLLLGVDKDITDGSLVDNLKQLLEVTDVDLEIIKSYQTREGLTNWILSVDQRTKNTLLAWGKFCINYRRVRCVSYLPIIRCYRCQKFGHTIGNCKGEQICIKCSGSHDIKNCDSDSIRCSNCVREGGEHVEHRTDDRNCPEYSKYRNLLLNKRL